MKWCASFALFVFLSVSPHVNAQSADPLPEIRPFIQQTALQQRFAESKEQDYVFREDTNDIRLRKDCTWAAKCPGVPTSSHPVAVAFDVVHYSERRFEIFWLDGVRVVRVLPSCNHCDRGNGPDDAYVMNIPISDSELASENQRVDREVAEVRALRAEGKEFSFPDDPPRITFSRMLDLWEYSNPRREVVEDRPTILLDFGWNSSILASGDEALLKSLTGTIAIDEEEHAVKRMEGRFVTDVKSSGGMVNIRKGTRVTITNKRVDKGVWLLAELDARGEGRYFSFSIDGDGHIFTGKYRKFSATTTILPGSSEQPPNAPASRPRDR